MIGALQTMLLGIVLLNLAFVQLTDAVSLNWMLGLWAAAAAAPLLERWRDRWTYRGAWNSIVLASFAFLVNDALTSGLLHMLEDGLLLAALCQVHLLNNVGRRQRPDLLFFNSFLIAFVTSFFCGDLAWSLCFCGYAALLVPALQLFVAARHGEPAPAQVRVMLRDGLPRSILALGATGLVFAFWPRDFHREGWLGDALQLNGQPIVAFAEDVRVDRRDTPRQSDAVVLRITGEGEVPAHWRGATFVAFDGAGWQPYRVRDFGTRTATDQLWTARAGGSWRRDEAPRGGELTVQLVDPTKDRLFLPLTACELRVVDESAPMLLDPKADGVVAVDLPKGPPPVFAVRLAIRAPTPTLSPRARQLLVALPRRLPSAIRSLAATLRGDLPADADATAIAEHACSWLGERRKYSLPGTPGAARNLDDFVLGTGGGHCEYFATTLALLLRLQDVPCRVVGGYLAHERDGATTLVRERDAHAWVEWLSPTDGWRVLDATPAEAIDASSAGSSWWQQIVDTMKRAWAHVVGFGQDDRRALLAWLLGLPRRVVAIAQTNPGGTITVALLLAGWLAHRRRRRARAPDATLRLRRAMRQLRLESRPGETPREMLARARTATLPPERYELLASAVRAHEAARYSH